MRTSYLALTAMLLSTVATAQEMPSAARLKADDEKLVSFGTRHSASLVDDPKRGIGAARRWFQSELDKISKQCGNCIQTSMIERVFTNERAPSGVNIVDVLGIQPGTEPNRVVIVMGHIDSRVTDVMNSTADAPGANDDGSGTVLVLEAARLLSKEKFNATIVYAALSGEEQGLLGGRLLATTAKERGWTVTAVLNNDIVGNTRRQADGMVVADRVRVFSEGIEAAAPINTQLVRRASGAEDDSPSRALARTIRDVAKTIPGGLDVLTVRRPDRFGRGGDHTAFLEAGFPAAVRFSVGLEDFAAQHQDLRPGFGDTPDKMDFPYLAKVTAINVATLRRLASAPAAPEAVTLAPAYSEAPAGESNFGRVVTGARVDWKPATGATGYRIYWKRADKYEWTDHVDVAGGDTAQAVIKGVIVDDNFLGVSALGTNGAESIVTFGGIPPRRGR
ncbi:M20/M25/M40 family metallo-hydrolase [Sphingobium nicotianae]|uniref:M20/M25/M40 family metallo-hydrolase n=1 Tax=Sphingobium nicotianae TaxID=2782607 RepID=A0A9X1ITC3_9SPHN|nr:M20/M25/M40 family metallo-hydrolase [Sphingobium nicotianae]MBT2189177.1 M20/M25/M40 family metallo-hydrolase [Sphingobium nicotianae]